MIIHSPIISGSLTFADGATFVLPDNGEYSGSFSGSAQFSEVSSHIIPDTANTYDLGSSTNFFRDLYISTGSLKGIGAGGTVAFKLGADPAGGLAVTDDNDIAIDIKVKSMTLKDPDGNGKNIKWEINNGKLKSTPTDDEGNEQSGSDAVTSELSGSFTGSVRDLIGDGNATFNDNVNILGTLDVAGLSSLDGGIDVDGAFTVADSSGNVSTSGTLGVTGDTTLQATDIQGTFSIGSTAVTSTAAELNILDGVTSDATELNLLDGSTAGTVVAGKAVVYGASGEVNATTLQIGGTSITSTAAELNILDGVTATAAELNYTDGVTSNIQTQLDGKLTGSGEVVLEEADKTGFTGANSITTLGTISTGTWNGTTIAIANGGTGATTAAGALTNLGLTATAAELNILDGVTVDATKINYLTDMTGNVKNYIDTEVAGIVDSAPGTLDTLNELAAALGDDPNFATTISAQIGGKVSQSLALTAGNGLTGGGDLTTDRTFNVVGTTDRISVSADAVDIASTYVGQTSITTLGTITTGTWNGTTVAIANGGTGATTAGGALTNLGLTATAAELNTLDGITATVTELNYTDGVTSNIQTQLDTLAGTDIGITLTGAVTGTGTITNLGDVSIATTATSDPTLTIDGDASGTATFTNLGNATLTLTIADDSHNHTIANVDGLQAALDAKQATISGGTGVTVSSNTVSIGQAVATNSNVTFATVSATGDIVAYASSDERLKDNIEVISNPIEKVQQLKGVTWDWNDNADELQKSLPNVGVIAQDVEKVLPQLVKDRDNGFKGVDYDKIVGLLIEAIKDQQTQIDELKSKLS